MRAHLGADRIRLGGRWDLRLIVLGVPVLAAIGFIQAYLGVPDHYGWDPSLPIPSDIVAAIATERATYAFPHSVLTILGSAPWLFLALFFLTSTTIGLEFGWGTVRTSLLASADRRRFLASRLLALAMVALAILASYLVLGAILPIILAATGSTLPPSPEVRPIELIGSALACVAVLGFVLSFAALLAIATRNPAVPFLIGILYFIVEGIVANLSQWHDFQLDLVKGSLPIASVAALLAGSLDPTRYGLAAPDGVTNAVDRPLVLSFAVVIGWAVLFAVVSDTLFRRSDIRE